MRDILFYLVAINAAAFGLFVWDKFCAQRDMRRVSEANLLAISALGGSPGAFLAQRLVRHKTVKQPFQKLFWTIVALQVLALVGLAVLVLTFEGSRVDPRRCGTDMHGRSLYRCTGAAGASAPFASRSPSCRSTSSPCSRWSR